MSTEQREFMRDYFRRMLNELSEEELLDVIARMEMLSLRHQANQTTNQK